MDYTVRFIYCVPSDQTAVQKEIALYSVMKERVREWFATQTSNGTTFRYTPIETHTLSINTAALYTGSVLSNMANDYETANSIVDADNSYNQQNKHFFIAGGEIQDGYENTSNIGGTGGTWYRFAYIEKELFNNHYLPLSSSYEKPIRAIAHELGHLIAGFGHTGSPGDTDIMNTTAGVLNSKLEASNNAFTAGQQTSLSSNNFCQYPLQFKTNNMSAISGVSSIIV